MYPWNLISSIFADIAGCELNDFGSLGISRTVWFGEEKPNIHVEMIDNPKKSH
jgi:hypothetical protein